MDASINVMKKKECQMKQCFENTAHFLGKIHKFIFSNEKEKWTKKIRIKLQKK